MENKELQDKQSSPKSTPWDTLKNISFNYDTKMQERAAEYDYLLPVEDENYLERYKQTPEPTKSNLIKAGRLLLATKTMQKLFPHVFKKSEKKQELEAMHIAYEHFLEEKKRKQAELEKQLREQAEYEKREKAKAEEQAKIREQAEAKKLVNNIEFFRGEHRRSIRRERIQEITERKFNETMTDLEELDLYAEAGENGVKKRIVEYEGKQVAIYDVSDYPLSFLTHRIEFKLSYDKQVDYTRLGSRTAYQLLNDPSMWTRNYEEEVPVGSQNTSIDSRSNTISTTYVNTETSNFLVVCNYLPKNTYYAFNHLEPDSIIRIANTDGATPNNIGKQPTALESVWLPEDLTSPVLYNEVQIRRYYDGDGGGSKKPDFIVTGYKNRRYSEPNEHALKHAAFHDIPIVSIDIDNYINKIEDRTLEHGK